MSEDEASYRAAIREEVAADPYLSEQYEKLGNTPGLAEEVERQCAHYRNLVPPAAYVMFEAVLIEMLTEDPIMREDFRALRQRAPVLKSDELPIDPSAETDAESAKKKPA